MFEDIWQNFLAKNSQVQKGYTILQIAKTCSDRNPCMRLFLMETWLLWCRF